MDPSRREVSTPDPAASWWRAVAPTEHGGWAFLGEPILLGLLVAFSTAGALVAVAALAAFLARPPLRTFVADRMRGRGYPRTVTAERAFAVCAVTAALALAAGMVLAHGAVLLPLALAAPFAATSLALDFGRRSRELVAEMCAALALGAVAPAIALAGGAPDPVAFGLWGALAARAVPSILYVRTRLRRARGDAAGVANPLVAHAVALAVVVALSATGTLPWTAPVAGALLFVRAAWGLTSGPPRSTARLGVEEIAWGAFYALAICGGFVGLS